MVKCTQAYKTRIECARSLVTKLSYIKHWLVRDLKN